MPWAPDATPEPWGTDQSVRSARRSRGGSRRNRARCGDSIAVSCRIAVLVSQALLVVALAAVGAASLRIASLSSSRGLELGLAAAALAGTIVVLESLALGLVGLGSTPVALALAAIATWLLARLLIARRGPPAAGQMAAWARGLGAGQRIALCALTGLVLAWAAWLLRNPFIGGDGLTYHLGTVIAWVHNGRPGAQVPLFQNVPIESYPLTTEVILTWLSSLARSYAPAVVAMVAFTGLAAASGWALLRRLQVDRLAAGLGVAAFVALPFVAGQGNLVNTDVPAVAWLACAGALAAAARARPGLLAAALLAGGLCLGSKTTPAPMLVAALAAGGWSVRARIRPLVVPLGLAALGAVLAGGLWAVRDLLQHGSPLWPFVSLPGGDPVPPALRAIDPSFLSHPGELLRGSVGAYLRVVAGGAVMLGAIVAAPLLAPRRRVLVAAALTAVGLLAWMNAPYTGTTFLEFRTGATRYLLSTYAVGALALALAAADGGRIGRPIALALLAGSAGWSLVRDHLTGYPLLPSTRVLLAGVLVGALVAAAGARVLARATGRARAGTAVGADAARARGRPRPGRPAVLGLALGVGAVAVMAVGAHGLTLRHATTGAIDAGIVRFLEHSPSNARGTVWMTPGISALAAGDRLRRTVRWFPVQASCARVREHAADGLVILARSLGPRAGACLHERARYADAQFIVF